MTASKEKWKTIPRYPDYQVSNLGRVRSLGITVKAVRNGVELKPYTVPGRVLQQSPSGPYYTVCLCKNGQKKTHMVHILVARTFKGKRPKGLVVRHLDGVGTNNVAKNIRYGTYVENGADASRHGTTLRGTKHPNSKLENEDVLYIKRRYKYGHSKYGVEALRIKFNVSRSLIRSIIDGKSWSWLHPNL